MTTRCQSQGDSSLGLIVGGGVPALMSGRMGVPLSHHACDVPPSSRCEQTDARGNSRAVIKRGQL